MENELTEILSGMKVPEMRRELNVSNVRWLIRNLPIQNGEHPKIREAMKLLSALARTMS